MDETAAYQLSFRAYTTARCGFDASGHYGIHQHKELPWAVVIAVAAHDGAKGREPRLQAELVEELTRFGATPAGTAPNPGEP